jgi:predicted Zn finger-like uncharacterized protein
MILTCPACVTRFLVEGLTIPAEGRDVRCGRCKHVWHQEPIAETEPPPADFQTAPVPESMRESPPLDWMPRPLTAAYPQKRRRNLWVSELAASVALIVFLGGMLLFRNEVVAAWEPAARFYDSVGLPVPVTGQGLAIEKLEVKTYRNAGKIVLLVSGHVVNTSKTPTTIPPLVLSVRDTAKRELLQWAHTIPEEQQRLAGGATIAFHTQQLVDNELATNLLVRFDDRGKQIALSR